MNIKNITGLSQGIPVKPIEKVERAIKSDITHDRDANGQQQFEQKKHDQGPMSDEQIQKAIEHLKSLPFIKEHSWTIELTLINSLKFVLVKDTQGQIIRKIPEIDLWTLNVDFQDHKGHLLVKAA